MEWLSSWLAVQGVLGSKHGLNTSISTIGYLRLLPLSRDMIERLKKQSKIAKATQPNSSVW